MPEYLHPGVYVEEIPSGAKPIEGVATSTAAFLGAAARGPVRPVLVTSAGEYERWFGRAAGAGNHLPDAVRGFFDNGGKRLVVCRIASLAATYAEAACGASFTLRAAGPGRWGTRVFASIEDSTARAITAAGPVPVGFRLRLACYDTEPAGDPLDWFNGVAGAPVPDHAEDFDDLVVDETSPDAWLHRLQDSALATLVRSTTASPVARPDKGYGRLSGGTDGGPLLAVADYQGRPGSSGAEPQGLAALALEPYREVALVYAPAASLDVVRLIVRHCEDARYRFAIVDAGPSALAAGFDPRSAVADSKNAAFYYPWIEVADPSGNPPRRALPPGGHVAGIYARTATERGVHKAPANEVVIGAVGLATAVGEVEQDSLNPRHVNVIRAFPGRGIRVWGARTLSSDPDWKYVNVRRLFLFIEHSLDEGTQWVVFEPSNEALWARVRDAVRQFLRRCWRDGALQGVKEEQAFFVRCDRTTMTADDILNGRLVCEVGIAPTRAAEFVIFRIFQQAAAA